MAKVYEFLANGFEEIEGLAPVDILRRGGVDIKTVSVTGTEWVETSHGVTIKADLKFEDIASFEDADMLMIPGGMPGSTNLNEHEGVRQALIAQHKLVSESVPSAQPQWFWQAQASSKERRLPVILALSSISARTPNIPPPSSRKTAT